MKELVHEKIKALTKEYAAQLPDKIRHIESSWQSVKVADNQTEMDDLIRAVHSLAGTAGTYGFMVVSDLARQIEALLREFAKAKTNTTMQTQINNLMQDLKQISFSLPLTEVVEINFTVPVADDSRLVFILDSQSNELSQTLELLNQFNYQVQVFDNLDHLKEMARNKIPNMVILDIDKVKDQGLEYIAELRNESVLIIYTSHVDDLMARLFTIRHGGQAFLPKPIESNTLLRNMDNLFEARKLHDEHILIVDDSPFLANYFQTILEHAGLVAKTVTNPKNFLVAMQEFQPDLILMDVNMPFCNGLELAQIVQQQESLNSVPIIFLSSISERSKQLEMLSLAGDEFLTKPIDPKHLLASIRNRLMRSRIVRSRMMRDSLTNLYNHSMIHHQLEREMILSDRYQRDLSVVLLDIDHFKKVNDTYGHQAGDKVLKTLSSFLGQHLRRTDIIGRYGGEEFLIILPNTNWQEAYALINEIRASFAKMPHEIDGKNIYVTISGGISNYPAVKSPRKLVRAADNALYRAKECGRNRIIVDD